MLQNKIEQQVKEKMYKTNEIEMQQIKTLEENQERLEKKNNIVVIMGLENSSKNANEKAMKLFKEKSQKYKQRIK